MKKQRILKLAAYMEKVEAKSYNQSRWLNNEISHENAELTKVAGLPYYRVKIKEGACGTTACVFGHAVAAIPEARLFFSLDKDEVYREDDGSFTADEAVVAMVHDGRVIKGFDAAMVALGISFDHAAVLFGGGDQVTKQFYGELTPGHVAAALRNYVATKGRSVEEARNLVWGR